MSNYWYFLLADFRNEGTRGPGSPDSVEGGAERASLLCAGDVGRQPAIPRSQRLPGAPPRLLLLGGFIILLFIINNFERKNIRIDGKITPKITIHINI